MRLYLKENQREGDTVSFDQDVYDDDSKAVQKRIAHLQSYHLHSQRWLVTLILIGLASFITWSSMFYIDEVAKASGEVIASSRVQIIQSVDGGVLSKLYVKEGDQVEKGQILATLDQTRVGASLGEVDAKRMALKAKIIRLRAEVTKQPHVQFPAELTSDYGAIVDVERSLFRQRQQGLKDELKALEVSVMLSKKELTLTQTLFDQGDASGSELLKAKRMVNEAHSKLINRKNGFMEEVRGELAKSEDELGQIEQAITRNQQIVKDSVFRANESGIVKNVRVTTVGGVLRTGEELMQIVPVDDDLIIEAKVSPADIARVQKGLDASIRFDAFDYTIYGSVAGEVIYVSADTLKEETGRGEEIYYRVHIKAKSKSVVTNTGRPLDILPGMIAQVDIRTGERALIDYLLKPLRKTLSESFGER